MSDNLQSLIRALERMRKEQEQPDRPRPQYHIWVNGDILPHDTPEERERNFLPTEPGDPDGSFVVHWHRPERLEELGYETPLSGQ